MKLSSGDQNSMLDPRSAIHAPHPDTREWFLGLEQYTEWKDRDQGLLRIKGNLA
ncbi:hypothetical protein BJX66DRAFT_142083 [Aspergillus keveii]|uniref:Uncharacterized protein n=1 Tax=Aspergillus keveii TaxID=714993 RepID=A0ABR4GAT8_9EURO